MQSIADVKTAIQAARVTEEPLIALTFTHCKVPLGVTSTGIPQLSMGQLNTIRQHLAEARQDVMDAGMGQQKVRWV